MCTCDCHKESHDKNEDVKVHITKIDKSINARIKGEPYCQSGQEECKMPKDCKWHNSSFASDYYRYRQDSIPKPQLSTPPTETARYKKTTQSFPAQTLCCLLHRHRQSLIKRKILPTVSSKELKDVYQLEDEENSMNIRPEQKLLLKNTAYGMQWKNEKPYNKNDVDSKVHLNSDQKNSEKLLNMKLSLLDEYLQSQFEEGENCLQQLSNASPNSIYEMVMDQILKKSVEYRSIKIRERTPSVSPPLSVSGEMTPDSASNASDAEDSDIDKPDFSSEDNFCYRNPHLNKRTTSTSSESSSSNEKTSYASSDSSEQATSWINSPKKHEYLKNSKLKILYENPFLHEGLFELVQRDQNMN